VKPERVSQLTQTDLPQPRTTQPVVCDLAQLLILALLRALQLLQCQLDFAPVQAVVDQQQLFQFRLAQADQRLAASDMSHCVSDLCGQKAQLSQPGLHHRTTPVTGIVQVQPSRVLAWQVTAIDYL